MALKDDDDVRPDGRLNTAYWLLLTVLLGLSLITPLLRASAVACTHDGHLHYHRVAAMAHAWENGIYLTRWLPDLAFGYGYPFFVYREAAPLYAVLLPHLAGLPLPAASNLFYALTILLCGIFMFLWVRDLFGPRAALVSAVAYMAAPYILVDALVRGNAPESLALPLFPFLLWVGRRWVLHASVASFIAGVLGLALLSMSHNISTFIFAPTLLVYLGALALLIDRGPQTTDGGSSELVARRSSFVARRLARLIAFLALGLGLAFFYSGGAVLEMEQVTLEMSTTTRNNDWRFNFASPGEILAPVAAEDPSLVNPPLLFRLGWVPLILAAAGLTGLAWIKGSERRAREQRLHIGLMAIGAIAFLLMALPISRSLWEALPLIDFVQFPWRFVGRAALPVAFLAGVPFYWFEARPRTADHGRLTTDNRQQAPFRATLIMGIAIGLLLIETIPNLYPRICAEEPFPSILTVHTYEHITGLVGVDPEGSYFPRTVQERPTGSPLEVDYAAGRVPQRFDVASLPPTAIARDIVYDGFDVRLTVDSPEPYTARYLSFAFPGWSARVDGGPVAIIPEDPTGLITFPVPAGTHEITVSWEATPLRQVLVAMSVLSAIGAAGVVMIAKRRPPAIDPRQPISRPVKLRRAELWLLVLVGLGLLGVKTYVDRHDSPLRRISEPPVEHSAALRGGELRLDGYTVSHDPVPAGETFDINMAWTAIEPPAVDYQSEISIVGPDGLIWSQKGTERPRVYEDAPNTRQWAVGDWGWDSREVRILSGTPPGIYDIVVTLFDKSTLIPTNLTDLNNGQPMGPAAVIGQIEVVSPDDPPVFAAQYPLEQDLPALGLRLLGYNQDRAEAAPGESVLLTTFWKCTDPSRCDHFTLRLADEKGATVQDWQLPAVRQDFALEDWPSHGHLRGQHLVQLPADLATGRYRFLIEDVPLGQIGITAPERRFDPPSLAHAEGATFLAADGTAVATLAGVAAESPPPACTSQLQPGVACSLSLVWRAEAEMPTSYHVFVHLVDEAGNLLAQSDAIPGNWTRPTTGWLAGEFIVDTHMLHIPEVLPSGLLSIRVGLYDAETGERLQAEGAEFATVPLNNP